MNKGAFLAGVLCIIIGLLLRERLRRFKAIGMIVAVWGLFITLAVAPAATGIFGAIIFAGLFQTDKIKQKIKSGENKDE